MDVHTVHVYPCVVVGCGGIGSGALYWLSKQVGPGVLGLEQYKLGHENGGSQDYSRTIRKDYTDKEYINLCHGAYDCWEQVEKEANLQLVYKTGGVLMSEKNTPGGDTITKTAMAMENNGIRFERLDGELLNKRFPQFTKNGDCTAIYLPDNGVIDPGLANAVHIQLARKHGATVLEEVTVLDITRSAEGCLLVQTSRGDFRCRRVVVTAGAWANDVLKSVGVHVPLLVTQEQVTYFATPYISDFTKSRFPCWSYFSPSGDVYYGIPIHGNSGTKVGIDAVGDVVTPATRTFTPNLGILNKCIQMCETHIPRALGPILLTKTCLYAMTMDRHFVIDTCHRTGFSDVVVCYGAGHAFKFASVLGKILADIVTDGGTPFNIKPFSLDRAAITDPDFKPVVKLGSWKALTNKSVPSKL